MRGAVPCLSADLTTHAVKLCTLPASKMGRRARRDGGAVMSEVSGDAAHGFLACLFPGLVVAMTATYALLKWRSSGLPVSDPDELSGAERALCRQADAGRW